MAEQGYNYLDGPIHSMAEFFETKNENLVKSIPPCVPSRNRNNKKRGSNKRKSVTFNDSEDKDSEKAPQTKKVYQYHNTCGHTMAKCTTLKVLV